MRILQIVHSLAPLTQAGTEIYTYNLSLELSKNHDVHIFSRTCDLRQEEYAITRKASNGIEVYFINNTFKECNSFQMFYENEAIDGKFATILSEINPDIVHIHHLVFLSTGLIKKIQEIGIPIVFTLHDYWLMCPRWHVLKKDYRSCEKFALSAFDGNCRNCLSEMFSIKRGAKKAYNFVKKILPEALALWLKNIYLALCAPLGKDNSSISKLQQRTRQIRYLLDSVAVFLAPSEFIRNKYIEFGIPASKIQLSPYGLNTYLFNGPQKNHSHKLRFAFIGTILPAKGPDILIKAFNRIKEQNAQLRIYGSLRSYVGFENYPHYLKRIVRNKNIMFMGGFDNSQIASVFKEIDVLVVPSIWQENSPLVIQEATLAKTPVIASRIGGIPELVQDGVNGLLCNPQDVYDLQEKIQYIIDNPYLIERFKDYMPKVKDIEENAREIEEIYHKINESKILIQK